MCSVHLSESAGQEGLQDVPHATQIAFPRAIAKPNATQIAFPRAIAKPNVGTGQAANDASAS
jgi:hypothetical protein